MSNQTTQTLTHRSEMAGTSWLHRFAMIVTSMVVLVVLSSCGSTETVAETGENTATTEESETVEDSATTEENSATNDPATENLSEIGIVETDGVLLPALADTDAAVGSTAPTFIAESFDGSSVEITNDGTARLYGFFAHWCPHCQDEMPVVVDLIESGSVPDGVEIVAISTAVDPGGSNYPPSSWFEAESWPGTAVKDSEDHALIEAFGLSAFPFWVAVDTEGTVVSRTAGSIGQAEILELLAQIDPGS